MRPLFAIAPLAAVLVWVGPTPYEANVALTKIRDRLLGPATTEQQAADKAPAHAVKPAMRQVSPTFSAMHGAPAIEASLK